MSEASFEERRGQLVHEVRSTALLARELQGHGGRCRLDEVVECGVVGEAHRRQLWGAQPEGDDGSSALSLPTLAGRVLPLGACVCCGLAGGAVWVDGALQAILADVQRRYESFVSQYKQREQERLAELEFAKTNLKQQQALEREAIARRAEARSQRRLQLWSKYLTLVVDRGNKVGE
jgi:hypothetical protein